MLVVQNNAITTAYDAECCDASGLWIARHPSTAFLTKISDTLTIYGGGNSTVGGAAVYGPIAQFYLGDKHTQFHGNVEITGNLNATGTIFAKWQDVAEWVPASGDMPPGTVVVLDDTRTNAVRPSNEAYDTRVAGVVSSQPGLLLGEAAADRAQVATMGRVRVRVDATAHPIRIGDLLVTSGKAGTAMASQPIELKGHRFHQPGTVIGKALEPLAGGDGEILVLLSMQ